MTRVDFYILQDTTPRARYMATCRLAEKAYLLGHSVYINAISPEQARHLDELLWTFGDGSFVPHELYTAADSELSPVLVGFHPDPDVPADVLINLASEVPLFFGRFRRLAEVVGGDEEAISALRTRYRFYRDRGYPLHTHKL